MTFDNAGMVSVFETTIRVLGGLLSAFELSREKVGENESTVNYPSITPHKRLSSPPVKHFIAWCAENVEDTSL